VLFCFSGTGATWFYFQIMLFHVIARVDYIVESFLKGGTNLPIFSSKRKIIKMKTKKIMEKEKEGKNENLQEMQ
jgi:hypothetical protein